jgi:hypothetical protein
MGKRTERGRPRYGKDYGPGWVGFVHADNALSRGIAYLTRWEKAGAVTVSHAFLVTGPDECVEANMPAGVVVSGLAQEYFDRPDRQVIFRKPRGLTPSGARRLVRRARAQVGARFDFGAFAAAALAGTFLGHLLNSLFDGRPQAVTTRLLSRRGRWVCSELVAYCLRQEPRYRGHGVLTQPPGTVSPQALFEDEELFEPAAGRVGRSA